MMVGIAILFRFGPGQVQLRWRQVLPGTSLAAAGWLIASMFYSTYLANFANYNATYGSLGAVIGSLAWLWLLMFILLIGAELNAALKEWSVESEAASGFAATHPTVRSPHRLAASAGGQPSPMDENSPNANATRFGVVVGSTLRNVAAKLGRAFSPIKRQR
jgi:hypothetical protein